MTIYQSRKEGQLSHNEALIDWYGSNESKAIRECQDLYPFIRGYKVITDLI